MDSDKKQDSKRIALKPLGIISAICLTIIYTKMLDVFFGLFLEGKFKNLTDIVLIKEIIWGINTNTAFHILWVATFIISSLRVATSLLVFEIDAEVQVILRKETSIGLNREGLSRLLLAVLVYMQFSALCIGNSFLAFFFFTLVFFLCWFWDSKIVPDELFSVSRLNGLLQLWRRTDPFIAFGSLAIAIIILGAKMLHKELPFLLGMLVTIICVGIFFVAIADFCIGRAFYKKLFV